MPIAFAKNELFDIRSNVMNEAAVQSRAVDKLKRNAYNLDPTEFLDCAEKAGEKGDECLRDVSLGMATLCHIINLRQEKAKMNLKATKACIIVKEVFSLAKAAPFDHWISLPSGRSFKIGHVLKPTQVSYYSSEKFNVQCRQLILHVYDSIDSLDDLMCCYSVSPVASVYLPVSDEFYEKMTEYFIRGYDATDNPDRRSLISRHCYEVLQSKLNRVRARVNNEAEGGDGKLTFSEIEAKELKAAIKLNGEPGRVFITSEPPELQSVEHQQVYGKEIDEVLDGNEKENDDNEKENDDYDDYTASV